MVKSNDPSLQLTNSLIKCDTSYVYKSVKGETMLGQRLEKFIFPPFPMPSPWTEAPTSLLHSAKQTLRSGRCKPERSRICTPACLRKSCSGSERRRCLFPRIASRRAPCTRRQPLDFRSGRLQRETGGKEKDSNESARNVLRLLATYLESRRGRVAGRQRNVVPFDVLEVRHRFHGARNLSRAHRPVHQFQRLPELICTGKETVINSGRSAIANAHGSPHL